MLLTVFSYKGTDYRSNRTPQTFEELKQAATKITKVHEGRNGAHFDQAEERQKVFSFCFKIPEQEMEQRVESDWSLS